MSLTTAHSNLFRHAAAEKAPLYRAVMEAFAAAKRQFRLHLRPDRVRDKSEERRILAERIALENAQVKAARARFCTGRTARLGELGPLDRHEFRFFLAG